MIIDELKGISTTLRR